MASGHFRILRLGQDGIIRIGQDTYIEAAAGCGIVRTAYVDSAMASAQTTKWPVFTFGMLRIGQDRTLRVGRDAHSILAIC
jgi:hypothetical protein